MIVGGVPMLFGGAAAAGGGGSLKALFGYGAIGAGSSSITNLNTWRIFNDS